MGQTNKHQKHLAIDLDGTLLQYSGFTKDEFGEPIPDMVELLNNVREAGWKIIIWTVRQGTPKLIKHLKEHNIPYDYINHAPWPPDGSAKVSADVYLDDRGINFNGSVEGLLEQILNFKPWYKK